MTGGKNASRIACETPFQTSTCSRMSSADIPPKPRRSKQILKKWTRLYWSSRWDIHIYIHHIYIYSYIIYIYIYHIIIILYVHDIVVEELYWRFLVDDTKVIFRSKSPPKNRPPSASAGLADDAGLGEALQLPWRSSVSFCGCLVGQHE